MFWIEDGHDNCIADDCGSREHEEQWSPRIAGDSIRNGQTLGGAAQRENGGGPEAVENPTDKDDAADQVGEFSGTGKDCGPNAQSDDGGSRRLKARMDLGKLFEKEIVVRHGVKNARSRQDHAVGGAERGDENREGYDDLRFSAENDPDGSGGDGVAGGGARGAKRDEISDDSDDIEPSECERAEQESFRKGLLWIDHFAGAVRAELPAFVSPEDGNHSKAEIGKKAKAVQGRAESGRQIAGVSAKRDKDCAEDHDNADLDESRPVLQIGTLARAPNVDNGDYGDHGDREDGFSERGERNDFREMLGERARERGDGPAGDHEEETPAIEKSGDAAESVADEAV